MFIYILVHFIQIKIFTNVDTFLLFCLLSILLLGFWKKFVFFLDSYLDASIVFQSVKTVVKYYIYKLVVLFKLVYSPPLKKPLKDWCPIEIKIPTEIKMDSSSKFYSKNSLT